MGIVQSSNKVDKTIDINENSSVDEAIKYLYGSDIIFYPNKSKEQKSTNDKKN